MTSARPTIKNPGTLVDVVGSRQDGLAVECPLGAVEAILPHKGSTWLRTVSTLSTGKVEARDEARQIPGDYHLSSWMQSYLQSVLLAHFPP